MSTQETEAGVDKTIRIGIEAKDLVSDITGILIYKSLDYKGLARYAMQPKSSDNKTLPDAIEMDPHMIEYVGPGLSARVTEPAFPPKFILGATLREIPTGITGMAKLWIQHMNGCRSYILVPRKRNDLLTDENPKIIYVDENLLEAVDPPGAKAKVVTRPEPAAGEPPRQGGMSTVAHRF